MTISKSHNSRGFSLVGVLTGIAVLSIVLIASAYVVVQTKEVEIRFDTQAELDRSHLLSLQKSRSVSFLRRHLNLNADPVLNDDGRGPEEPNALLLACLSRTGSNCRSTSQIPSGTFIDVPGASEISQCSQGNGCNISSAVQYKVNCSSDRACESLEVQFITSYNRGSNGAGRGQGGIDEGEAHAGPTFRERKNLIKLPGALFASRGNIGFGCTANQVMNGINFQTLQAVCQDPAPRNCAGNAPIQSYGPDGGAVVCPQLVSQNCTGGAGADGNGGMRTVGLFSAQSACRTL